ncbi:MbnP family copper-binding protein [Nannocystis punicea]|uniref:Metallo-mystery pair system four-Cys motif protein n=1 Tax=Nannocystis punicea TaxID=2995304 RepID=A0ABY7H4M9_9BACT|nr:MbnP family copper-binding protein [Nannocystis poenicansa]WAS94243.1 metallo-mystery pair system four-Cys motif protein [Nannocystis poenicansa]
MRVCLLSLALLAACTGRDTDDGTIELFFRPTVGSSYFSCNEVYPEATANVEPQDFRLFIHAVRLVTADGEEHPLELLDDGQFQARGVALLDFEDASGECRRGTPALNKTVRGVLSEADRSKHADYVGLRFRVGVPPELDLADPASLPPPLDEPTLRSAITGAHLFFTAWAKQEPFSAADPVFTGVGIDLGADGCIGNCQRPNQFDVALDGFDPDSSTIVADWRSLYDGLDLRFCSQASGAACGCWSRQIDALCPQLFPRLGLDLATGAAAGTQVVFHVD